MKNSCNQTISSDIYSFSIFNYIITYGYILLHCLKNLYKYWWLDSMLCPVSLAIRAHDFPLR